MEQAAAQPRSSSTACLPSFLQPDGHQLDRTLPAGAAPGHVLLGYPSQSVSCSTANCLLPIAVCSQHFNQHQQFDCRMQNQLERLMGMQEGNRKKKSRTSTPLQNKTKNPIKTPELIFILEGAASKPQTQDAGGLSSVTPCCASLPAQQRAESQGNPRAIYSRVEMNPVFISLCLLQRAVFFQGNISGILKEAGKQRELDFGLKGWEGTGSGWAGTMWMQGWVLPPLA